MEQHSAQVPTQQQGDAFVFKDHALNTLKLTQEDAGQGHNDASHYQLLSVQIRSLTVGENCI